MAVTALFAKVWIVTPSIVGGTITPNVGQVVEDGEGVSFTIMPGTPGEVPVISTPGGANTCPGVLTGPVGGNYTYSVSPVTADCAFHVAIATSAPGLSTVKAMTGYDDNDGSGSLSVGDVMTYAITVTNTGNALLNGVMVEDARLTPARITCSAVQAGGTCVLTGTAVVTQAEADAGVAVNTAVVTVGSVPGVPTLPPELCPVGSANPLCAPTASSTVTQHPAIAAAKTATLTVDNGTPGVANVGDVITYAVTVTNTGDVTLNGVTVDDTLDGYAPTALACAPTTLAPGQSATCATYTHTITVEDANRPGGNLTTTWW